VDQFASAGFHGRNQPSGCELIDPEEALDEAFASAQGAIPTMNSRTLSRLACGTLIFVLMPAAWAFRHADHEELPNFEKRVPAAPTAAESAAKHNAAAELGRRVE